MAAASEFHVCGVVLGTCGGSGGAALGCGVRVSRAALDCTGEFPLCGDHDVECAGSPDEFGDHAAVSSGRIFVTTTARRVYLSVEDSSTASHYRRAAAFLTLLAIMVLAAACSRPQPAREVRIAVDTHDPLLQLPLYAAVRQRLFAAQRVKVAIVEFATSAAAAEAVTTGAADVAVSGFDQVLAARHSGGSLMGFAVLSRSPLLVMVASPHEKKRFPPDLTGDQIAVVEQGDATERFARYVARQGGTDPDDVEAVPCGSMPAAADALADFRTDVGVLDSTAFRQLTARAGPLEVLADTRTLAGLLYTYGVSTYPASCLFAKSAWLGEHREEARRLARAVVAAVAWIRTRRTPEVAATLPESYRKALDPAILEGLVDEARPLFSMDGEFTPDGAEAVREVLAVSDREYETGVRTQDAYTNEFVRRGRR